MRGRARPPTATVRLRRVVRAARKARRWVSRAKVTVKARRRKGVVVGRIQVEDEPMSSRGWRAGQVREPVSDGAEEHVDAVGAAVECGVGADLEADAQDVGLRRAQIAVERVDGECADCAADTGARCR